MSLEPCKHPYYKYVEGILVCSECKKPSPKFNVETKTMIQPDTKAQVAGPRAPRADAPATK